MDQKPPVADRTRRTTLADVAKLAGVSVNTVSAALHQRSGSWKISEATRTRVQQAARTLHYTPNQAARSLCQAKTNTIGFYCPFSFHTIAAWPALAFAGLQRGCAKHGLDLLLHATANGQRDRLYDVQYAGQANGKVDGLILCTGMEDAAVAGFKESGFPLVSFPARLPGITSVVDDYQTGMGLIARHLHQRGHRRIVYRDFERPRSARCRAFVRAATRLGMTVSVFTHALRPGFLPGEAELVALDRPDRSTALVGSANYMVTPVLAECLRLGWRIPQDLAVAGYDGSAMVHEVPPRFDLTNFRTDWPALTQRAVDLLVDQLQGRPVPACTVIPGEFVPGDTV